MKLPSALFCLGFAVISVHAAHASVAADVAGIEERRAEEVGKSYKVFKTRLGWTYRDVKITQITDAGISIVHEDGSTRLGYERLTPEQRSAFGITRDGAQAQHAKEQKAKAAYEAHLIAKRKAWQEAQQKAQAERQKAQDALLAQETIALLEAERLQAERLDLERMEAERAEALGDAGTAKASVTPDDTSIVAALEVPQFPVIRGYDNEVFRPLQGYTRHYRRNHYGSNGSTIYSGGYGGTYGYPVRYSTGCYGGYGYGGYGYGGGYHRGTSGYINYNGGNWNITAFW